MSNKAILYILPAFGLLFPVVALFSYYNNDFDLKFIYLFAFIVVLGFFVSISLNTSAISFINNNLIVLLLFLTFGHTFLWFTVLPIVFRLEYNQILLTALMFISLSIFYFFNRIDFKTKICRTTIDKFLLFFIFITISYSVFIANVREFTTIQGFSKVIIFFSSIYFFSYLFPMILLRSERLLDFFIKVVYSLGVISAVYGIFTALSPNLNPVNEYPGLSLSFFSHPNANAFLYCYTIPCAFYIIIKFKKSLSLLSKTGLLFSVIISIINQFLTYSRTGILAILLGITIFIYYYNKKVFFSMLVLLPFLVYMLFNVTTSEKGASTIVGRAGLIATGIEMLVNDKNGMLWGFGIDNNFKVFEETKNSLLFPESHNYPHNSLLFLTLVFGAVPVTLIVIFLIKRIIALMILFFKKKLNLISVLSYSIVISVFTQAFFEDFVLFPEYYMYHLILIFIGLLFLPNFELRDSYYELTEGKIAV